MCCGTNESGKNEKMNSKVLPMGQSSISLGCTLIVSDLVSECIMEMKSLTVKSFKKSYPGLSESVTFSGYL